MKNYQVFILFLTFSLEIKSEGHNRVPRIIGGYYNGSYELDLAKHIVSIRIGKDGGISGTNHMCAGTIISNRSILTATHCVVNQKNQRVLNKDLLTVVAGSTDRLKKSTYERYYKVKRIVRYPILNFTTHVGDLAILKLTEDIEEDGIHIQRLNLTNDKPVTGQNCIALGWGKIIFNGPLSDKLVFLNMTILPIQDCLFFAHISFGVICAGEAYFEDNTAGPGDSGGPFVCNGKLAGVISFIVPIRTYMTSVWFYRDWIVKNYACSNYIYAPVLIIVLIVIFLNFF